MSLTQDCRIWALGEMRGRGENGGVDKLGAELYGSGGVGLGHGSLVSRLQDIG